VFGGFGTGHVYKSVNAGMNWTNISGNLPDVPHQCVVIDPLYPQNVYVGNDLGVYVTTNAGSQWFEYRTGMPYALVFDLTIVYPNRHVRATTHGNGIWERSLVQNPVGIKQVGSEVPKEFVLNQNYPNPFNPETKIRFGLPSRIGGNKNTNVQLVVFDVLGKVAATLVNKELSPGYYEIHFNANGLSSGTYFYRLKAGDFSVTKKMLIIR
jgi:hypothetical protein